MGVKSIRNLRDSWCSSGSTQLARNEYRPSGVIAAARAVMFSKDSAMCAHEADLSRVFGPFYENPCYHVPFDEKSLRETVTRGDLDAELKEPRGADVGILKMRPI